MSLLDFKPEWQQVKVGKGGFPVRGLSLEDLSALVRTQLTDLQLAFEMISLAADGKMDHEHLVLKLVTDAPVFCARIITAGSGAGVDDAAYEVARTLPMAAQLDALVKIGTLTFEDAGGPGNFVAMLLKLARSMGLNIPVAPLTAVMGNLISSSGSTASGEKSAT